MNTKFANKLVELRKSNGLSQEELAEKLGLSRQAISKWERGESSPDLDNIIQIAKLYKISFNELFCICEEDEEIIEEVEVENTYANYCSLASAILGFLCILLSFILTPIFPIFVIIISCITIVIGGIGIYIAHNHYDSGKTMAIVSIILAVVSMIITFYSKL